jgi:hypothetical protein
METFVPLDLPPGLVRNGTSYQNRNRWIDGQLIRFHEGTIRPVGGWAVARTTGGLEVQATGFPRYSYSWRKNDGTAWIAMGSSPGKLYVFSAGVLTDITPAGLTQGVVNGTVSTGVGAYGADLYGGGIYGGGSIAGTIIDADTWSLDNFGEALIACFTADGKVYSSIPTAQATQVTNSPTGVRAIVVTPERFLVALGTTADPRAVTWASQETMTTWTPAVGNSAGDFTLQTNGRPMSGRRTDRETLIWTDADCWSMNYIGGQFIYAFNRKGDNCGLLGPNAVAMAEGAAYWMSDGQFFRYDGAVRSIPCDVADYVFADLDRTQRTKIIAVPISQYGEMWWFYPALGGTVGLPNVVVTLTVTDEEGRTGTADFLLQSSATLGISHYVTLNYRTGVWTTGSLGRSAGVGAGVFANPMLWDETAKLYTHETGQDRGGTAAFVESGPLELGDGDRVLRVQSLVPDERALGQVRALLYAAFRPMETESLYGPYTLNPLTDVRVSGRQFRFRLEEATDPIAIADGTTTADGSQFAGSEGDNHDFRIGRFRAGVIAGGGR